MTRTKRWEHTRSPGGNREKKAKTTPGGNLRHGGGSISFIKRTIPGGGSHVFLPVWRARGVVIRAGFSFSKQITV